MNLPVPRITYLCCSTVGYILVLRALTQPVDPLKMSAWTTVKVSIGLALIKKIKSQRRSISKTERSLREWLCTGLLDKSVGLRNPATASMIRSMFGDGVCSIVNDSSSGTASVHEDGKN